jgi:hypothetical protein
LWHKDAAHTGALHTHRAAPARALRDAPRFWPADDQLIVYKSMTPNFLKM